MKKRNIVLASHGRLAGGVYHALKIITGPSENVSVYGAYMDGKSYDIQQDIEELLGNFPEGEEIIVLTDLYGGSVNTAFVKCMEKYRIYLVSGLNLPLALYIVNSDEEDTEKMICGAVEQTKESICFCNQMLDRVSEDEDF